MNTRILIIANPGVGIDKSKRAVIDRIAALITDKNGNADITYSMKPGMGKKYSSLAKFEGYSAVFAAGGDGTINDVASGLVGRGLPLGIIPLGTGNGLARGLGIPLDEKSFTEVLFAGKTSRVDVGKIANRHFFATGGIGYDARIAHDFNRPHPLKRSLMTYILLGIKHYFFSKPEDVTLIIDGSEYHRRIFALTVANTSQYGSGAIIAPNARPTSGVLVAVIIPKINLFKALPAMKKLFDGTVNELEELELIEFKTLKIKRQNPGLFHVDGETFTGEATLMVTVLPGALTVIMP